MHNTQAALQKSTDKERLRGQSRRTSAPSVFWFPVYEGIFEHAPILEDAVWLFMWCIARTTDEGDGDGKGKVLGGIPIPDERPAEELGVRLKTVRRWRRMLDSRGYVSLVRTPYGFRYTLLKSKKWQKPSPRELPKQAISRSESAPKRQRDLPLAEERLPGNGRVSDRSGKYKEDNTEKTQKQYSGRHSTHVRGDFKGGGYPLPKPSPLRRKPTNRRTNELYWVSPRSTHDQIVDQLERRRETVADYLAGQARGKGQQSAECDKHVADGNVDQIWKMGQTSTYKNVESLQKYCREELGTFTSAFAAIDYPFAWNNPLLGSEFCQNARYVVEASRRESPPPMRWELCERVLDRCEKSWSELGEYCDVGLAYCPPDFNDHINRLFEREENVRVGVTK